MEASSIVVTSPLRSERTLRRDKNNRYFDFASALHFLYKIFVVKNLTLLNRKRGSNTHKFFSGGRHRKLLS